MNKFLALFAMALTVPVLADPVNLGSVTTGTFGDIENTATVPTAVSLKTIQGGGDVTVTEADDVITVSFSTASEADPVWTAEKGDYLTKADATATYVAKAEGKDLVDTAVFTSVSNTAATAVQTVAKAAEGAEELTVTQTGTAVTIDIDLDDYVKSADLYTHATDRAHESGLYKVATDAAGHVSAVSAVVAADITALVPEADDYTAAEAAKVTAAGTKLAAIAAIDTDSVSTLNEVIATLKAIVAAAQ